jgi:hypothetical protein
LQPDGGGLSDVRVVGEPQIVVGTEIEDFTLGHANCGPLRAKDLPLRFVEACRADFSESLRNGFLE